MVSTAATVAAKTSNERIAWFIAKTLSIAYIQKRRRASPRRSILPRRNPADNYGTLTHF
jgi:hypothetical protein